MPRIIVAYGFIAGAIIIGAIVLGFALDAGSVNDWLGFVVMFAALTLIFFGVKRYRDVVLGGVIHFAPALALGLGIAAVASAVYVTGWELYLALTGEDFIGEYTRGIVAAKQAAGASAAELAALEAEMAEMRTSYANPAFRIAITLTEILPAGALVALVSAALLRNSRLLPARK
jgi:Protein of unknown function (DUF4199)